MPLAVAVFGLVAGWVLFLPMIRAASGLAAFPEFSSHPADTVKTASGAAVGAAGVATGAALTFAAGVLCAAGGISA
jgi:hypothetical protein